MEKLISITLGLLLILCCVSIQAQENTNQQTPPAETPSTQKDMKSMEGKASGEGEVIAFLTAVDEHEIAAGKCCISKESRSSCR